jgi:hypothetical protein
MAERLISIQRALKAPKSKRAKNYSYRSAEDILEAVKPLLAEQGVMMTISDTVVDVGTRFYVRATVRCWIDGSSHEVHAYAREGDPILSSSGVPIMSEAQVTGSSSSYARKYALNGMFLIDDTRDDDDMADEIRDQRAPQQRQAPPPRQPDPQPAARPAADPNAVSKDQWAMLYALAKEKGMDKDSVRGMAANLFSRDEFLESLKTMRKGEVSHLINTMKNDGEIAEAPLDIDDIPF